MPWLMWILSPIGRWLAIAFAVVVGLLTVLSKAKREGRELERAKQNRERIAADAKELDRLAKANKARRDAEQRARDGKLRDEFTRDD